MTLQTILLAMLQERYYQDMSSPHFNYLLRVLVLKTQIITVNDAYDSA